MVISWEMFKKPWRGGGWANMDGEDQAKAKIWKGQVLGGIVVGIYPKFDMFLRYVHIST